MTPAEVVEDFLARLEAGDAAGAAQHLAPTRVMRFPGGVEHPDLDSLAAVSRRRYRSVGKVRQRYETWSAEDGCDVVLSTGTLFGENLHGVRYAGVRYVDRFRLRDGRIEEQDVWNDLAESRVLEARSPDEVPERYRPPRGGLLVRRSADAGWDGALRGGSGRVRLPSLAEPVPLTLEQRREPTGSSPEELLAAAHAACFAMALRGALDRAGAPAEHAVGVEATCDLRIDGSWAIEAVHLVVTAPDHDPAVLAEAVRGAEAGCAISVALADHVQVDVRVRGRA